MYCSILDRLILEQKNYDTAEKYYMQALDMQTRMINKEKKLTGSYIPMC